MEHQKQPFGKTLLISIVVFIIIIALVVVAGMLNAGADLCFLGVVVWAKCFHLSFKPLDILKVWTGAFFGVLICAANMYVSQVFGTGIGGLVLLGLILVQLIFDLGSISDWVVNAATPFFLTLCLVMSHHGESLSTILYNFAIAFLLGGVLFMIVGAILVARFKKKMAQQANVAETN